MSTLSVKAELRAAISRSVNANAWHGPAVLEALANIGPAQAVARPVPKAHSIWELTLHLASWMDEAAERLAGRYHVDPLLGDFSQVPEPTDSNWQQARAKLIEALAKLDLALEAFAEERLGDMVDSNQRRTFFDLLAGVAQHNTYHAGQIVLLGKLLRGQP